MGILKIRNSGGIFIDSLLVGINLCTIDQNGITIIICANTYGGADIVEDTGNGNRLLSFVPAVCRTLSIEHDSTDFETKDDPDENPVAPSEVHVCVVDVWIGFSVDAGGDEADEAVGTKWAR